MIDLDKLSPAPWEAWRPGNFVKGEMETFSVKGPPSDFMYLQIYEDAAFIALARNWLDVQERRKWCVSHEAKFGWWLEDDWDKDGERFDPRRFDTVLEAWQRAVDYDRELTAKGE